MRGDKTYNKSRLWVEIMLMFTRLFTAWMVQSILSYKYEEEDGFLVLLFKICFEGLPFAISICVFIRGLRLCKCEIGFTVVCLCRIGKALKLENGQLNGGWHKRRIW